MFTAVFFKNGLNVATFGIEDGIIMISTRQPLLPPAK